MYIHTRPYHSELWKSWNPEYFNSAKTKLVIFRYGINVQDIWGKRENVLVRENSPLPGGDLQSSYFSTVILFRAWILSVNSFLHVLLKSLSWLPPEHLQVRFLGVLGVLGGCRLTTDGVVMPQKSFISLDPVEEEGLLTSPLNSNCWFRLYS